MGSALAPTFELLIALFYQECQVHRSDPKQKVNDLDQPVQIAYKNLCLCESKGRKKKGIEHTQECKPPGSSGSSRHHAQDEQKEGTCQAKSLVNARSVYLDKKRQN